MYRYYYSLMVGFWDSDALYHFIKLLLLIINIIIILKSIPYQVLRKGKSWNEIPAKTLIAAKFSKHQINFSFLRVLND